MASSRPGRRSAALRIEDIDALLLDGSCRPRFSSRVLETPARTAFPAGRWCWCWSEPGRRTQVETRLLEHVDDFVNAEHGRRGAARAPAQRAARPRYAGRAHPQERRARGPLRAPRNRWPGAWPRSCASPATCSAACCPRRSITSAWIWPASSSRCGRSAATTSTCCALGPSRIALALGDVMGKGVPAALLAANLKACLHAQLQAGDASAAELVARVNRLFWEVTPKGLFASLFFSSSTSSAASCAT